jgi:Zn-dependent protease/CBS domain-containing protein
VKWSFKLGEFAGIGVFVHVTFFLLIAWIALSHLLAGETIGAAIEGIVFVLAIFLCVVLHEYGHALTARRFGVGTRDIVLLPIGGVARLEQIPEDPRQELWIAVAGPAVNVVIAAGLFLGLTVTGSWQPLAEIDLTSGVFLERLMLVNVFLVLFNMIPAFPMDGGRVLRALLAMRLEYVSATRTAANVGQAVAFLLGFIGLFTNPFLVLVALFVWIGAGQEASFVEMRSALAGIPVGRVMITDYRTLAPGDRLHEAIDLTIAGSQTDFPVVRDGVVVGVLTQGDLLKGLAEGGRGAPVDGLMRTTFETADVGDMTETAFQRLQSCDCHTMPVLDRGRLVGLITSENVGEFLRIQAALGRA